MDISGILHRLRIDLPRLSELSGVSLAYLKQLSAGNQGAGPETRAKIAAAIKAHRAELAKLERQLGR